MRNPILPSTLLVALLVFLVAGVPIEAAADPGLVELADGSGDSWEPIDTLAHHNVAVASDNPEWLIGPTEQSNRFHTSSNVRIREVAPTGR